MTTETGSSIMLEDLEKKSKIDQSIETMSNSEMEINKETNSGSDECQFSLTNSLSPTISMDSQKSTVNPGDERDRKEIDPVKRNGEEFPENPLLRMLKESLLSKDVMKNGQSRELLFQLGNHLMNLATSQEDDLGKDSYNDEPSSNQSKLSAFNRICKNSPESNPEKLDDSEKKSQKLLPNLPAQVLLNGKYRETAFQCSCNEEFENLYIFTIHMKDTGHKPKASPAEKDIPKLVRGQDMWINSETEQTKEILRCMHCQQSFRSLPELTMHMIKTNHYSEIVYQDANNLKNNKNFSDSQDSGKSSGRSSKKSSPDKSQNLKRKNLEPVKEAGEKKFKSPISQKTSEPTDEDSDENPLFSLQKLVNITSNEKSGKPPIDPGSNRISPQVRNGIEPSFFDLFQRLDHQMNNENRQPPTDPMNPRQNTQISTPPSSTNAHSMSANGLNKKAKCHFCGKPFANKGQVRLHISKNKCPSLMQKNCHTPYPSKTVKKTNPSNDTMTNSGPKQDLQFTNPHLNAAFNLLQRQFPDEQKKPVEKRDTDSSMNIQHQSSPPQKSCQASLNQSSPDVNNLLSLANLFSVMNQASEMPPISQSISQPALLQQQLSTLATLIPFLSASQNCYNSPSSTVAPTSTTNSSSFNLSLMTSLLNPTNSLMPSANPLCSTMNDFSLENCLDMAKKLSSFQSPNQLVNK